MNVLDIVLSIILAIGLIGGFQRGLIKSISGLFGIGLAIWIGFNFSNLLDEFVAEQDIVPEQLVRIVSLLLTIFLVVMVIKFLAKILHQAVHTVGLGFFNRLGGAISGFLLNLVALSSLVYFLNPFLLETIDESLWNESQILPYLTKVSEFMKISFL